MSTQTTARPKTLTYPELLAIAQVEVRQAKQADDQANRDYYLFSQYGQRHTVLSMDAWTAERKRLFVQTVYTGAELRKAQIRVTRLERFVAEGRDRLTELEAERTARARAA